MNIIFTVILIILGGISLIACLIRIDDNGELGTWFDCTLLILSLLFPPSWLIWGTIGLLKLARKIDRIKLARKIEKRQRFY